MEALDEFFIQYGYWGMMLASLLAGTFVPFSSEAVMGALLAATHMDPWITVLSATVGNVAGSMINYYLGRLGRIESVCAWLHVKPQQMQRALRWTDRYGAWIGFFAFLPLIGTAISIALGLVRAHVGGVFLTTLAGKFLRYVVVAYSVVALV